MKCICSFSDVLPLPSAILEGMEITALLNWSPKPNFSKEGNDDWILYISTTNSLEIFQTSRFSNEYECIIDISQGHAFNSSEWKIIIDTTPSECIRYNKDSKVYEIKKSDPEGDRWEVLKSKSSGGIKSMVNALTYNQGIFQTWDQQSLEDPSYEYGFNSGGNYNFVKLKQISDKL